LCNQQRSARKFLGAAAQKKRHPAARRFSGGRRGQRPAERRARGTVVNGSALPRVLAEHGLLRTPPRTRKRRSCNGWQRDAQMLSAPRQTTASGASRNVVPRSSAAAPEAPCARTPSTAWPQAGTPASGRWLLLSCRRWAGSSHQRQARRGGSWRAARARCRPSRRACSRAMLRCGRTAAPCSRETC